MNQTIVGLHPNTLQFYLPDCFVMFHPYIISENERLVFTIIYSVLIPCIIGANIISISGIIKTKRNKFTKSQVLFIILYLSDLSFGIIQLPYQIYLLRRYEKITCYQTIVQAFWFVFPIYISGTTLFLISIKRYMNVAKKKYYKKIISNTTLTIAIILENLIATFWSLYFAFVCKKQNLRKLANFLISSSSNEGIFLAIALLLNIALVRNVRSKLRNTTVMQKTDSKLTTTIRIIATAVIISYLLSILCFNVAAYTYLYSKNPISYQKITVTIIWSLVPAQVNAVTNALIYISRNQGMKKHFKSVTRSRARVVRQYSINSYPRDTYL